MELLIRLTSILVNVKLVDQTSSFVERALNFIIIAEVHDLVFFMLSLGILVNTFKALMRREVLQLS